MFEQQVQNGIKFLNEHIPNWREKINIYRLNMVDPYDCILGQLNNNFYTAMRELKLSIEELYHLGFITVKDIQYKELTKEWKKCLS